MREAPDATDRGMSRLDTVLYQFYAKTVAVAAQARRAPGAGAQRNKWFSMELGEYDAFRRSLQAWKTISAAAMQAVPPLVVAVRLRVRDGCEVYAQTPQGPVRLVHPACRSAVVEKWRLSLRVRADDDVVTSRLPAVYKQAIVHFRTMYAVAHMLPLSGVCEQLRDDALRSQVWLEVCVGEDAEDVPLAPVACDAWSLSPIYTPLGSLQCHVDSARISSVRVQRTLSIHVRPSTPVKTAPGTSAAQPVQMRSGASRGGEPGALRSLFTHARLGSSPRSPSSLTRTPPYAVGSGSFGSGGSSFDAYMAHRAGRADAPPSTEPRAVRVPRYSRQPSYRHRSMASHDDSASHVRSWSMRMEERRQHGASSMPSAPSPLAHAHAHAHAHTQAHGSSPGYSRVFAGPSPAPAFALPRQRRLSTLPRGTPSSGAQDALDLVAMIDASRRDDAGPPPARSADPYDDILTKMAGSLHLQALDEVFGTERTERTERTAAAAAAATHASIPHVAPYDSDDDAAAGRLDLSLDPM